MNEKIPVPGDPLRGTTREFQDLRNALRSSQMILHPSYQIDRTASGQSIIQRHDPAYSPWQWSKAPPAFDVQYDGAGTAIGRGGPLFWWMHVVHETYGGPGWRLVESVGDTTVSISSARAIGAQVDRVPSGLGRYDIFGLEIVRADTLTDLRSQAGVCRARYGKSSRSQRSIYPKAWRYITVAQSTLEIGQRQGP